MKKVNGRRSNLANPFIDSQFKLIFDENNTRLFLNSILKLKSPIAEIHIENCESNDYYLDGKRVYFDVHCKDESGREFIVEMQNAWYPYLTRRIIYYTCRTINRMGNRSEYKKKKDLEEDAANRKSRWNYDIKPVYTICLLNERDRSQKKQYLRQDVVLYDTENGREFSDAIRIVIINLPMLEPKNIGVSAEFYENLLFLLKQISEDMNTVDELIEQIDTARLDEGLKSVFRRVVQVSDVSNMTEEQLNRYEDELKVYRDWMASLYEERNAGMTEGKAIGMEKGRAEGEAAGIEKGKNEEKLNTAKMMKRDGVPVETICKYTGLKAEQVKEL